MKEGSTEAPIRHPLDWTNPDFYDEAKIEAEMERVFDICHGCRRCFNLCDSFPILFDLIDDAPTGELDSVEKSAYKDVVDACTLCDMCFLTKCPYVPPHDFDLDFPHLMLRYRAAELKREGADFTHKQLAKTDRNGKMAEPIAGLVNWASKTENTVTRSVMQSMLGIDKKAELPEFHSDTFDKRLKKKGAPEVNQEAPAFGKRKAVIYTTCLANYQNPDIGTAAIEVLAKNGVETEVVYPACCGMPYLEQGDIAQVAEQAEKVSDALMPYVEKGYDVLALTASCGLMLKFEWPLILKDSEKVQALSKATWDIAEYIVDISKKEGLVDGLHQVEGGVSVHHACHARAQNMGPKSAEMLRLIPDTKVTLIERCSGHGGTFGIMKETKPHADKIRKPVLNQVKRAENETICSDCALACKHITQGMREQGIGSGQKGSLHPIEIFAQAYGLAK
ncbi:MAG: heterodisulfide reductase-related iron-sulfur binding cluster [Sphingomonadales bacterium]|jgi:glycerol-3-phosphate dehydrogenase subunit C